MAESESLLREASLAWGCKSSQLHAEDRMSILIMEMDREAISNFYGWGKMYVTESLSTLPFSPSLTKD